MITRRTVLATLVAGRAAPIQAAPPTQGQSAGSFIEALSARLTATINGQANEATVRAEIQRLVDDAVDVDGIAQFCLGAYWRSAAPSQQQEYLALFHGVLSRSVTANIAGYRGVEITVGRVQSRDGESIVSSGVRRPGQAEVRVDWVVGPTASGWKIQDLIAEGTSLRLTQRSDYVAYLGQHGGDVAALLVAMRQKLQAA